MFPVKVRGKRAGKGIFTKRELASLDRMGKVENSPDIRRYRRVYKVLGHRLEKPES